MRACTRTALCIISKLVDMESVQAFGQSCYASLDHHGPCSLYSKTKCGKSEKAAASPQSTRPIHVPSHSKGEVCVLSVAHHFVACGPPAGCLPAARSAFSLTLTAPESCGQVGMIQQIRSSQQNAPQGQTYTGTECSAGPLPMGTRSFTRYLWVGCVCV